MNELSSFGRGNLSLDVVGDCVTIYQESVNCKNLYMSYYLFLDDIRSISDVRSYLALPEIPDDGWVIVRSYDEFVQTIDERGIPTFVTFDHDLAPEHYGDGFPDRPDVDYNRYQHKTGMDCCKYLVERCIADDSPFPRYRVHSWNPVGAKNIMSYIVSFNRSRNNHVG